MISFQINLTNGPAFYFIAEQGPPSNIGGYSTRGNILYVQQSDTILGNKILGRNDTQ